jgi:hypothetical protein
MFRYIGFGRFGRETAKIAIGAGMNILESGCIPLKLLEEKIDNWINSYS